MSFPRTGAVIDTLRLCSGLTLFLFALTHFLNHALGLWSLDAMVAAQRWRLAVTRSPPGTLLLGLALSTHLVLALWRIARLKSGALPRAAAWQLATGALISFFLMPHLFEAGIGPRLASGVMSYPAVLGLMWPIKTLPQTTLLLLVWTHGCVGLHQWLKGEAWWRRVSHGLAGLAVLIPAAALAGFLVAGREVERLKQSRDFPLPYPTSELPALHAAAGDARLVAILLMTLALLAALAGVALARRRRRLVISYEPGPKIFSAPGATLLEISRAHRVPHLSVCGGKARCSTCRVRVLEGANGLAPPSEAEAMKVSKRSLEETRNIMPTLEKSIKATKIPACLGGSSEYSSPMSRQSTVVSSTSIFRNWLRGSTDQRVPTPCQCAVSVIVNPIRHRVTIETSQARWYSRRPCLGATKMSLTIRASARALERDLGVDEMEVVHLIARYLNMPAMWMRVVFIMSSGHFG